MEKEDILKILKTISYPGFSRDIISFGIVSDISIDDEIVRIKVELSSQDPEIPIQIEKTIKQKLHNEKESVMFPFRSAQNNLKQVNLLSLSLTYPGLKRLSQ